MNSPRCNRGSADRSGHDPGGVEPWRRGGDSGSTPSGVGSQAALIPPGSLVPRDPGLFTFQPFGLPAPRDTPSKTGMRPSPIPPATGSCLWCASRAQRALRQASKEVGQQGWNLQIWKLFWIWDLGFWNFWMTAGNLMVGWFSSASWRVNPCLPFFVLVSASFQAASSTCNPSSVARLRPCLVLSSRRFPFPPGSTPAASHFRPSDFGLLSGFGFRISEFELSHPAPWPRGNEGPPSV